MEDIVYESEILPELEIEEALTLEQMLAFQPRFVAFSDQDILAYVHQLLKSSPQKAELFARLHKQVIHDLLKLHDVHKRVTFIPHALIRKDYEDADFISEMNDAKQASSYTVQQMGVDRVMFPFVLEEDGANGSDRPIIEHDVDIHLGDYPSRILKTDPVQVPIDGASWKISTNMSHPDYLFDAKLQPMGNMNSSHVSWTEGDSSDMNEWILTKVRPSIQKVLEVISDPMDIHTLHRVLAKYGYELEHLKTSDFDLLRKHVHEVLLNEPDIHEDEDAVPISPSELGRTFVGFGDTLQNEGKRASMLITDDESMKLQTKHRTLLESVPPLPLQIPLASPAEIAKELRNGTSTMETVAEQLIQWYLRWFLDNVSRFMEKYQQNNVDMDKVEAYMRRLQQVGESILLTSTFDFIHQYTDVAELKEGNDTSAYDGAPSIAPQVVFEESANEEFVPSTSAESNIAPDMEALELFDTNTTASETIVIMNMQELENLDLEPGQREVILDAWKKVHDVHVASGLPINISNVLQWCKQYITRSSRSQQILTKVPGISETIAYRILHPDINIVAERIQDLHSKEWRESLQQSYKSIHDEWIASTKHATLLIMTKWWIDLCEQSVQGTLRFTPLQGMVQHIHTWSSYGPPMQPDAKSGILSYMTEVAESVAGMDARTTRDDMKLIAAQRLETEIEKLKTKWEALQASGQTMNKSDRARLLLENTIKAIKSGQSGVDILHGYLPGLLYLPQLLPAKRVAKKAASWIQGCCAAPLDESFKADSDWRTQLSALYKIKRFLAKERWSVQARTVLNGFTKESTETNPANANNTCGKPSKTAPLQDSVSASQLFEMDLSKDAWQWIPRSHMDMLTKYPNEVEGWAKKVIDAMYPGEKTKSAIVFKVITQITSVSSLLSFLNRIGKNLREKVQDDRLAEDLSVIKTSLRDIPSGKVSTTMIQYVSTIFLAKPADIDHGNLSLPTDMTRQTITSIWNKNYQLCTEWNTVGSMMNATEVQAFITKVREQQKEISLQRLDILSIEDRQTLLDAKNLGLLRIVQFNEIHVDDETITDEQDRTMDLEGEQDFTMVSRDADPDVDEL